MYGYFIIPAAEFDAAETSGIYTEYDGEFHVVDEMSSREVKAEFDRFADCDGSHSHIVAAFQSQERANQYQRMLTE